MVVYTTGRENREISSRTCPRDRSIFICRVRYLPQLHAVGTYAPPNAYCLQYLKKTHTHTHTQSYTLARRRCRSYGHVRNTLVRHSAVCT